MLAGPRGVEAECLGQQEELDCVPVLAGEGLARFRGRWPVNSPIQIPAATTPTRSNRRALTYLRAAVTLLSLMSMRTILVSAPARELVVAR
jgi:hypothetical protein